MKRSMVAAFGLCSALSLSGPATASSFNGVGGATPSLETKFIPIASIRCTRDDNGWRYMRGDRRVDCRPGRPRGAFWTWRTDGGSSGWWHGRDNRWHDGDSRR
jgi:hypothetical protein